MILEESKKHGSRSSTLMSSRGQVMLPIFAKENGVRKSNEMVKLKQ